MTVIIDDIYRNTPPDQIPWNHDEPPEQVISLLANGTLAPCRCIDLGCGTGTLAIYLAQQGFEVTGVDLSPTAITMAKEKAKASGVSCMFFPSDITGIPAALDGTFELATSWMVLHHLFPEQRPQAIQRIADLLKPEGLFLAACFSDQSTQFGGTGKYRTPSMGTRLYFSSQDELLELFSPYFELLELKTIDVAGSNGIHRVNLFLGCRS